MLTRTPEQRVIQAIEAFRAGQIVLLLDDESRENEGDMIMAAERVSAEKINFMIRYGSGIICLCLTQARLNQLELPVLEEKNCNGFRPAFAMSIEAKTGVTTGVSAADRARTIQVAMDDNSTAADLVRPGHMFPLRAKDGGVLQRQGHTEGSVDLARISGLKPAAVLCELMNVDGTMARMPDVIEFAKTHALVVLTIDDLIQYREKNGL